MSLLTVLIIILVVLAIGGGGWGYSRYGAMGWSPVAILLIIAAVLYFTGYIKFG